MTKSYRSAGILLLVMTGVAVTGCGSSAERYRPIVDGARASGYEADLVDCQQLSTQRSYLNDDVKSEAIMGTVVGALIGAATEGKEGAVAGAVFGGAVHGAERAWEVREERKQVIIECMVQRGHRVVG